MARVVLDHVFKRFGNVTAVSDACLEIKDKEFLVLVGPSGCGKSTTLRMIAGLEELTEGNIYIDEKVVNDVEPKNRDIAFVFQNYALYPHMDVYNNMAYGLRIRKFSKADIDRMVKEAAAILGIENLLDRKPAALSGGQRQRVALGRAIVRSPKVFLMDEPLSNLDAKLRVQMRAELGKLQAKLQTTTIYVTHDQVEAMTLGDRIVVMKDGMIQQVGAPLDIYDNPDNMFVAGFIGAPPMNFLEVTIVEDNGGVYVDGESFRLKVSEEKFKNIRAFIGKEVVLGIRPEDVADKDLRAEAKEEDCVLATVQVTEPMGAETYVYLSVGDHDLTARFEPFSKVEDGEDHMVVFSPEKIHLFDKKTEKAIR